MNLPVSNEASPSARLTAARRKQWHQQGEALLTIENARSFLNATGLVLFAPRPQIAAPAPSFVEAVLGAPEATPTLAQIAQAKELLARLVAEGLAVPLNLLGLGSVIGQPADAPDFIASAQVFSYIFTLRGDKGWKQPPQPAGPSKFSNLAIAAHELLAAGGPLAAYDLTRELGNEVTETAVLRALGELWSHLRVLPLPQLDGRAALWELATARLTKQIKAGANAGQPTALSALISLYLGQAIVASEDEIESFLSPLAARSRIRDVVHALMAARQLDSIAIEGRTMLHVAGAAPAFLTEEPSTVSAGEPDILHEFASVEADPAPTATEEKEEHGAIVPPTPGSRIAKFVPRGGAGAGDLAKAKPARKSPGGPRKPFGEKRAFAPREAGDRGPFRDARPSRPFRDARPSRPFGDARPSRTFGERTGFKRKEQTGDREQPKRYGNAGRPRSEGEDRSRFEKKRFAPRDADAKPRFERRERGTDASRERRPFVRKEGREDRPPRPPFDRTGKAREGRRPFDRTETRGPRKPFGKPNPFGAKKDFASGEDRPRREFKPRPFTKRAASGEEEKSSARGFGGKKPFGKPAGFAKKPGGFSKPFRSRPDGERRDERPRGGAGFGGENFGSGKPRGTKSAGGFGAKSGGGKSGPAKFGPKKFGGKKPFGKPKATRSPRPSRGDSEG